MLVKTFSGEVKDFDKLEHQHLSNIYWFNKILNLFEPQNIITKIEKEFNGEILPYRPHPDFKQEILSLEKKGYLVWRTNEKLIADISYKGKIVGEFKTRNYIRDEKINQII